MDKELKNELMKEIHRIFEEKQKLPHQFIVAYYRKKDDSLLGYHMSTWCNYTNDPLEAKRYANENPYPQLKIISDNIKHLLTADFSKLEGNPFAELSRKIRENQYEGIGFDDIYIDAIYLAEGTPPQECNIALIDGEQFGKDE